MLNLIDLGDRWISGKKESNLNINLLNEPEGYRAVSGCMAAVKLRVKVKEDDTIDEIAGTADSRVALGMLAFIALSLQRKSVQEILQLDPIQFCKDMKVDGLLPSGRLNGFQNMIHTVQLILKDTYSSTQDASRNGSGEKADPRQEEVAVLLSGGVDSSVALSLLQQEGKKVRAYYLKIWLEDELAHLNECPWEEDLAYAQQVCDQLGIPLETLSLQKEYWQYVVQYTLEEAKQGRTPNPDIMCNSRIKFGMFYQYIRQFHGQIATGHYATVERYRDSKIFGQLSHDHLVPGSLSDYVVLGKSPDPVKDQSYFLSNLSQEQLRRCLFPIGHLEKRRVRQLAEAFDLPTKARKDSQGICFLGKLPFDEFIGHYMGEQPGEIRHYLHGTKMGTHKGLWFHTINQRRGIGLLLDPGFVHDGPWYVAAKDVARNVLYVTNDMEHVDVPRRRFAVQQVQWNLAPPLGLLEKDGAGTLLLDVKLRHGKTVIPGRVTALVSPSSSSSGGGVQVELATRDKGIAPGQYAAFYLQDYCLGAGMISSTEDDEHSFAARQQQQQQQQWRRQP